MIDIKVGSVPSRPKAKVPYHLNAHQIIRYVYLQGWLAISGYFVLRGNVASNTERASAELKSFSAAISWEVLTVLLQHATRKWLGIHSFGSLQIIAGAKVVVIEISKNGNLQQRITMEVCPGLCQEYACMKGYYEYGIKAICFIIEHIWYKPAKREMRLKEMLINYTLSNLLNSGSVSEMIQLFSFSRPVLKWKSKIHKLFHRFTI